MCEYLPHSAKGTKIQPAVTVYNHPTTTCSFPGHCQSHVGARKEKGQPEPPFLYWLKPSQKSQLIRSLTFIPGPKFILSLRHCPWHIFGHNALLPTWAEVSGEHSKSRGTSPLLLPVCSNGLERQQNRTKGSCAVPMRICCNGLKREQAGPESMHSGSSQGKNLWNSE